MMGAVGFIFIALCHNVSFIGKTWCVVMLFLRLLIVILAGSMLFWDEQEKFICNTLHPGCSNVCFDSFTPVSVLRLWFLQLILLCLAHLTFATHVTHKVLGLCSSEGFCLERPPLTTQSPTREETLICIWGVPQFYDSYLLVVILRILLEVIFSTGQFYLVGLTFPKSFFCNETPCSSGVECFVSRPTEKTLMLNFMLVTASLSVLLSLADFVSSMKLIVKSRRKNKMLVEKLSKGEQSSTFTTTTATDDSDVCLMKKTSPKERTKRNTVTDNEPNFDSSNEQNKGSGLSTPERNQLHSRLRPPVSPRMTTLFHMNKSGQEISFGQPSEQTVFQDKRAWV